MMKRNSVILTILFITYFIILPILSTAAENKRDGNWWRDLDSTYKSIYITGLFDGMDLGKDFSVWKLFDNKIIMDTCIVKVNESYNEYSLRYFKGVSNIQIVDGLNSFYSDYRNRSIAIDSGVWLVLNGIAGTPKDRLDSMIENFRRNANK